MCAVQVLVHNMIRPNNQDERNEITKAVAVPRVVKNICLYFFITRHRTQTIAYIRRTSFAVDKRDKSFDNNLPSTSIILNQIHNNDILYKHLDSRQNGRLISSERGPCVYISLNTMNRFIRIRI